MEQIRRLQIAGKYRETPDAQTFALQAVDGQDFKYQPGQFLSLILPVLGREKRRAYSFSSAPGVDELPAITVKRVLNGEFSNWLFHHARVGDVLTTTQAFGRFLLPDPLPAVLVYIVAGSGVTPVISHLKTLLARPDGPKILLYYASRDSSHTIFKEQLDAWIKAFPGRFECVYFFSREKNADHGLYRHLNNELLADKLTDYFGGRIRARHRRQTRFFLCAPPSMMRTMEMTLRMLDFPATSIQKEAFLPDARLPVRTPDFSRTHRIIAEGPGQRREFQTYEGETILNAALRQGVHLPYTCKSGVCFTCLARCVHGEVDVVFVESTRRESAGAMVNTCIGYAVSEEVTLRYE